MTVIGKAKAYQDQRRAYESDPSWYALRVAPTCPPSTQVVIRGGVLHCYDWGWGNDYNDLVYTVPSVTVDLMDTDYTGDYDLQFTTASYYQAYALVLKLPEQVEDPQPSDWYTALVSAGNEYETATEAEDGMEVDVLWGSWPYTVGYTLCGLILRNTGTINTPGEILPIDPINRGRSYIWPSDIRPRWIEGI